MKTKYLKAFKTTAELQTYLSTQDVWLPCLAFVQNDWSDVGKWNNHHVDMSDIVWAEKIPFVTNRDDVDNGKIQGAGQNHPFVYYEKLDDGFSWVKTANETLYFWDRAYRRQPDGTDEDVKWFRITCVDGELNIDTSENATDYAVMDNETGTLQFYNMHQLPKSEGTGFQDLDYDVDPNFPIPVRPTPEPEPEPETQESEPDTQEPESETPEPEVTENPEESGDNP